MSDVDTGRIPLPHECGSPLLPDSVATAKTKRINPLKLADGYPRLVLVATPGPDASDPARFTVTVTGHNMDDPVLALDMVKDVLPHLVRAAHEHLYRTAYAAGRAAAQSPDDGAAVAESSAAPQS